MTIAVSLFFFHERLAMLLTSQKLILNGISVLGPVPELTAADIQDYKQAVSTLTFQCFDFYANSSTAFGTLSLIMSIFLNLLVLVLPISKISFVNIFWE